MIQTKTLSTKGNLRRKKVARNLRSRAGGQAQKSLGGKPVADKAVVDNRVIGQPVPYKTVEGKKKNKTAAKRLLTRI